VLFEGLVEVVVAVVVLFEAALVEELQRGRCLLSIALGVSRHECRLPAGLTQRDGIGRVPLGGSGHDSRDRPLV
jgi:hypothetical protein